MLGSQVLEVIIGIVFFYLLMSLGFTALNELIAMFMQKRPTKLKEGIIQLLQSPEHVNKLYDHPLIKGLSRDGKIPSYIPSRTFALTLLSVINEAEMKYEIIVDKLRNSNDNVKRQLLPLFESAQGNIDTAISNIENWYNNTMDRVSGWYKRWIMLVTVISASIICVLLNADTIMIAKMLWNDSSLRSSIGTASEQFLKSYTPSTTNVSTESLVNSLSLSYQQIHQNQFPIGWSKVHSTNASIAGIEQLRAIPFPPKTEGSYLWGEFLMIILYKICGIAFTVLAITIGAPFWFDALGNIVKLRASGAPVNTTQTTEKK
jgi:hypothetical protein